MLFMDARIEKLNVSAFKIPTDRPEADGTMDWDSTTLVLVEARAGGTAGMGYGYADAATARFIHDLLARMVEGRSAMAVNESWQAMVWSVRNHGRPGIASMAISAVDVALWDLKSRLLNLPLFQLLGQVRESIPVYGSGGFTSYTIQELESQLGGWTAQGIRAVKMKIGTHPDQDLDRVRAARGTIGPQTELFVDANGAYSCKQALGFAEKFAEVDVKWFEEPVSSDDLAGLRLIRDRAPAGMDIAAGEYGYDLFYFRRMLEAGAVDVLMADSTRCGGITGFLQASDLTLSFGMPFSAHTAPSIHAHACCASIPARHLEYFHDHARIEHLLFDGALTPVGGALHPDPSRPGLGLEFKEQDAERWRIFP